MIGQLGFFLVDQQEDGEERMYTNEKADLLIKQGQGCNLIKRL